MRERKPCIYILTNKPCGVLYTGMTTDLAQRNNQHVNSKQNSFVKKYNLSQLVYIEYVDTIEQAAIREKQIKEWKRRWKIELIEKLNLNWEDLKGKTECFY